MSFPGVFIAMQGREDLRGLFCRLLSHTPCLELGRALTVAALRESFIFVLLELRYLSLSSLHTYRHILRPCQLRAPLV